MLKQYTNESRLTQWQNMFSLQIFEGLHALQRRMESVPLGKKKKNTRTQNLDQCNSCQIWDSCPLRCEILVPDRYNGDLIVCLKGCSQEHLFLEWESLLIPIPIPLRYNSYFITCPTTSHSVIVFMTIALMQICNKLQAFTQHMLLTTTMLRTEKSRN